MKLFYSHASRQKPLVREIAEAVGRDVGSWIDETGIRTGDDLAVTLTEAVTEADLVVLMLCRDAAKSDWVRKEVDQALDCEKTNSSTVLFVIVIDNDVLDDPKWGFVKGRKYLTLSSFEATDIAALGKKLHGEVFSWAVKRYDQLKGAGSLVAAGVAPGHSFALWLKQEALADLDAELEETVVERRLSEVFVCPPLLQVSAPNDSDEPSDPKPVELNYQDIVTGDESWVVFVPPEFAGLSHVSQQLDQESVVPAGAFEFDGE